MAKNKKNTPIVPAKKAKKATTPKPPVKKTVRKTRTTTTTQVVPPVATTRQQPPLSPPPPNPTASQPQQQRPQNQNQGQSGQRPPPPKMPWSWKNHKQELGLVALILLLALCFFYFLLPWMKNNKGTTGQQVVATSTSAPPKVLEVQTGQSPLLAPTGSNGTTYYIIDPKVLAGLISTNVVGGIHITQIATQTVDGQRANGNNTTNTTASSTTTINSQQVEKQPVNVEIHELANCGSIYEFEVPDGQNVRWDQTEGSKMIVYVDGFTYTGTATTFQTGKKIKFISQTTYPFKIRLRFYEK